MIREHSITKGLVRRPIISFVYFRYCCAIHFHMKQFKALLFCIQTVHNILKVIKINLKISAFGLLWFARPSHLFTHNFCEQNSVVFLFPFVQSSSETVWVKCDWNPSNCVCVPLSRVPSYTTQHTPERLQLWVTLPLSDCTPNPPQEGSGCLFPCNGSECKRRLLSSSVTSVGLWLGLRRAPFDDFFWRRSLLP